MAKILIDEYDVIRRVDTDQEHLLGHLPHQILGKATSEFEGPLTDSAVLRAAIANAGSRGQESEFFCTLYGREGESGDFLITCEPHRDQPQDPNGVLLSLEPSQAIPLSAVFEPTPQAWALLQAEWPYFVDMINPVFSTQFGYSELDIVGQNLHRIKPPRVPSAALRRLLHDAASGRRSHEILTLCNISGAEVEVEATCVPVVTPPSSAVEYLLVRFAAPRPPSPSETA